MNVANLLLTQALERLREVAIRAAVGASRARIVGQLLTESVLLSFLGGVLGIWVASFSTGYLAVKAPNAAYLPRGDNTGVDDRAFLFTFGVAPLTGIAAGLFPAAQASCFDLASNLKDLSRAFLDSPTPVSAIFWSPRRSRSLCWCWLRPVCCYAASIN
jgi:ABC-type antimicrobial peptide transport system permease subunit